MTKHEPYAVDVDTEAAVLGSVLLEYAWDAESGHGLVSELGLSAQDFYAESHRILWRHICDMRAHNISVDTVTLMRRLRESGDLRQAGGGAYLVQITNETPAALNTLSLARCIRDDAWRRRQHAAWQDVVSAAETGAGDERLSTLRAAAIESSQSAPSLTIDTLGEQYGIDELEADQRRQLVTVAQVDTWRSGPTAELNARPYGWGPELGHLLGGLSTDQIIAVGAASAKAGKSAFVNNLLDGLALQCADESYEGVLTPVVLVTEMSPSAIMHRRLSRYLGHPAYLYRHGVRHGDTARRAWDDARAALAGRFGKGCQWVRPWTRGGHGVSLVATVLDHVRRWRLQLEDETGRDVLPILCIDPIQRWQDPTKPEVEALNEIVEALNDARQREPLCIIVTSDSTKATASGQLKGDPRDRRRSAFRGSYKLQHVADALIVIERQYNEKKAWDDVTVAVVDHRWGPPGEAYYQCHWPTLRFSPTDKPIPKGGTFA